MGSGVIIVSRAEGARLRSTIVFITSHVVTAICPLARLARSRRGMHQGLTNPGCAIGKFWLADSGYFPRVPKKISDFAVQGQMVPAAIIWRIGELAPELRSYLDRRKSEYNSRRGILPGSPGAILHGNMDPEVNLHLRNVTVREILNATVLYSVRLRDETPANSTGYKLPPTSWMFEFVMNPDAPTGLGGTPRWVAF